MLGWAFVRSRWTASTPDYGSTVIFGVGGIFVIWAFLMRASACSSWWSGTRRAPAFFRNETFAPGWIGAHAPDIVEELRKDG